MVPWRGPRFVIPWRGPRLVKGKVHVRCRHSSALGVLQHTDSPNRHLVGAGAVSRLFFHVLFMSAHTCKNLAIYNTALNGTGTSTSGLPPGCGSADHSAVRGEQVSM